MENNKAFWVLFGLIGLVIGSLGTTLIIPPKIITNEIIKEVPVEKIVEISKEVPIEVEVKVPTADASLYLDEAIKTVFDKRDGFGRDDEFLSCDNNEFGIEEISVSRVNEWRYLWIDEDEYEVSFEGKFLFNDDSDERNCRETRNFTVLFEEGERPEATWN